MEAYEAILTRRSIRKYTSQPVPEELVKDLLRAAMNAPSAGNQRPWQFVVIDRRQTLDEMAGFLIYGRMLREAQLAIMVCGDLERENRKGYWVQDCSAATENLLLAAHARGLGAVWLGVYPREERVNTLRALFSLPENVIPLSIVSIGYPDEQKTHEDRSNEALVHYNRW